MSRRFLGVSDQVEWSIGGCSLTGAWTMAAVLKLDTGVTWQSYLNNAASGASRIAFGRHGTNNTIASYTGGGANTKDAVVHSSADGWMLVATTRAAGLNQLVTHHKYPIGGSPAHTVSAVPGQDNQTAQNGVFFGQIGGSDWFDGWLAVAAEWSTALSDGQIESLVTSFTRANWLSLSPAGLWDETDAFATDQTGNGATRVALTGTSDDADDPAGWGSWIPAGAADMPAYFPGRMLRIG